MSWFGEHNILSLHTDGYELLVFMSWLDVCNIKHELRCLLWFGECTIMFPIMT